MDPPSPQQFYAGNLMCYISRTLSFLKKTINISDRGGRRNRGNFQPYQRRPNNNRNWNQNNRSFGHHHAKDEGNVNIESYLHPSFFENPWKDLYKSPEQDAEAQSKVYKEETKQLATDETN
jgi:hypothetical protein